MQADLKWTSHINILVNKISKTVGIINQIKYVLATVHLKLLYQSNSLESLYKPQKRAVRVISFAKYHDHSKPLFHRSDILNIYLLCLNQILTFVYKSLNRYFLAIVLTTSLKQLMSTVIKLEVMNRICILIMLIRSVELTRSHLEVLNTGSFSPII